MTKKMCIMMLFALLVAGCGTQSTVRTAHNVGLQAGNSLLGLAASWADENGEQDSHGGSAQLSYDYFLTDDISVGAFGGAAFGDEEYFEAGGVAKVYTDEILEQLKVTTFAGYGLGWREYQGGDSSWIHGPVIGVLRPMGNNVVVGLEMSYEMVEAGGPYDDGVGAQIGIGWKF